MAVVACVTFSLLLAVYTASAADPTPPVWPGIYFAEGVLRLPYAELEEPFTVFFDTERTKRSRINFYGDMVETLQWEDEEPHGQQFEIVPMTTEDVLNVKTCFQVNGSADAPVGVQTILPDLKDFKFVDTENVSGKTCNVWENRTVVGNKVNTYTMYTTTLNPPQPVQYIMMGYDTLLGSHYDKYIIDYTLYNTEKFETDVFDIPKGMKCRSFPGPGIEARILSNPMQEYIGSAGHTFDRHHELFNHFTDKHDKDYVNNADMTELSKRREIFKQNVRYIHGMNRKNLGFKLAINHLADKTEEELTVLRGHMPSKGGDNGGTLYDPTKAKVQDLPDQIDWRLYGAVTQVKDQAVCGSCWSFGTTGTIEGAHFLKTGQLVRLSQQNLVDCTWGFGNNGCDGGEEWRAYQWMMKHGGIAKEEEYGEYLAQDGYCHFNVSMVGAKISGFKNVPTGNATALKSALVNNGPVAVDIDAAHKSLSFYSHGVYYEPECGNTPDRLDHSVLAVGYGTLNGQDYWLIKNSWSTYWGNNGYVLMSQKDNNCGVETSPTFVSMD